MSFNYISLENAVCVKNVYGINRLHFLNFPVAPFHCYKECFYIFCGINRLNCEIQLISDSIHRYNKRRQSCPLLYTYITRFVVSNTHKKKIQSHAVVIAVVLVRLQATKQSTSRCRYSGDCQSILHAKCDTQLCIIRASS